MKIQMILFITLLYLLFFISDNYLYIKNKIVFENFIQSDTYSRNKYNIIDLNINEPFDIGDDNIYLHNYNDFTNYSFLNEDNSILVNKSDFVVVSDEEYNKTKEFSYLLQNQKYDYMILIDKFVNLQEFNAYINILDENYKLNGLIIYDDNITVNIPISCTKKKYDEELVKEYAKSINFIIVIHSEFKNFKLLVYCFLFNKPALILEKSKHLWKYLDTCNSIEFNEKNFSNQLDKLLREYINFSSRKYFINHFGMLHQGKLIETKYKKKFGQQIDINNLLSS